MTVTFCLHASQLFSNFYAEILIQPELPKAEIKISVDYKKLVSTVCL